LKKGQLLEISRYFFNVATDYTHLGTNKRIACSYKDLAKSIEVGKKILIADGGISTVVTKI
jgi:pyruvate kinase